MRSNVIGLERHAEKKKEKKKCKYIEISFFFLLKHSPWKFRFATEMFGLRTHASYPVRALGSGCDSDGPYASECPFFTENQDMQEDVTQAELQERSTYVNGHGRLQSLKDAGIEFESLLQVSQHKVPVCPIRTGIKGKGSLIWWGPNHSATPVITRKDPQTGEFQFVAVRSNNSSVEWAIPVDAVRAGEVLTPALRRKIKVQVGSSDAFMNALVEQGAVVFQGVDLGDARITDNAWVETTVFHAHLTAATAAQISLESHDAESPRVKWMSMVQADDLHVDHRRYIDMVLAQVSGDGQFAEVVTRVPEEVAIFKIWCWALLCLGLGLALAGASLR